MALTDRYRDRHSGWNIKHFHTGSRRDGGTRGYTWVKKRLQEAGLVETGRQRGVHRKRFCRIKQFLDLKRVDFIEVNLPKFA